RRRVRARGPASVEAPEQGRRRHQGHLPRPRLMPIGFRYSRWDGTQAGFELEADDILSEITDDLLYHGDLNAALRRMMQSGFRDQNGERMAGLRELMEKLRRRRKDELEKYDLGGVYDDIAQELREVVDQERQGIDQLEQEARQSGDQRRQEITEQVAQEKRMQLDLLPPDLAGQVRELSEHEFTSSEARERFDELMDKLREQLMQSYFNQMSGAMQDVSPEQMQRMKDMLSALNQMLEQRSNGQEPDFESFMQQYGDFFPGNPQSLDELLEQMAEQMAAMQAMLNSMTPEQRAQLQGLAEQLLEDMDLRWQVDQLGEHLRGLFPQMGWDRRYNFSGQDPLGFAEAAQLMDRLGDIDQLENLMRSGVGHERNFDSKPYEYGDPFNLQIERTLRNAIRRTGGGTPVHLQPDDFEVERTEVITRSSTVLMLDLSLSMPMRDNFLAAKKVAMALHSLISSQFPRDYLGIVGFSEVARELKPQQLPEVSWDFVYGTNMQHAFLLSRRMLARQSGTKQIIMVTDGEPTAHLLPGGEVSVKSPPVR